MIVNVCPAADSKASPDRIWEELTATDRLDQWVDGRVVGAEPPGVARPGQVIHLVTPALGRDWPVTIDIVDIDPARRWIDMVVRLPLGIENHEHITLTERPDRGTLVRFN